MQTIRQKIIDLLSRHEMDARDLSHELGLQEKEIYSHLEHVARSMTAQKRKMVIHPSQCLQCGYVFENRKRFTRPGRCPQCKRSHLQSPRYQIR
ncbi:MAG: transcriptional regulator [Desulfobacterales bacterium]|jgi:predicted Zn-ribbon and HTH transcriptional regulator